MIENKYEKETEVTFSHCFSCPYCFNSIIDYCLITSVNIWESGLYATEVTKDVSGEVTQAAGDITDAAKQSVEDAWGSVKDTTQKIKDTVVGKAEESTESVKRSAKSIKPNFTA